MLGTRKFQFRKGQFFIFVILKYFGLSHSLFAIAFRFLLLRAAGCSDCSSRRRHFLMSADGHSLLHRCGGCVSWLWLLGHWRHANVCMSLDWLRDLWSGQHNVAWWIFSSGLVWCSGNYISVPREIDEPQPNWRCIIGETELSENLSSSFNLLLFSSVRVWVQISDLLINFALMPIVVRRSYIRVNAWAHALKLWSLIVIDFAIQRGLQL